MADCGGCLKSVRKFLRSCWADTDVPDLLLPGGAEIARQAA
jgi:hypothetical protein